LNVFRHFKEILNLHIWVIFHFLTFLVLVNRTLSINVIANAAEQSAAI
jgi:hypothetical protein